MFLNGVNMKMFCFRVRNVGIVLAVSHNPIIFSPSLVKGDLFCFLYVCLLQVLRHVKDVVT